MQSLAMGLSYQINPRFSVKADVDYQMYTEAKGSTRTKHLDTGKTDYYGGNAGSQTARTVLSSLAVNYHF